MRSSRPRRSSSWTASEVQAPDANVVSLVPSISETLMAWGIRPAAVTRFCEVPGIPTVGGTKNPDVEAIIGMGPDLVVMDAEENRVEDADTLRAAGIRVHATHVRSLPDVEPMLVGLWEAVGGRGRNPSSLDQVTGAGSSLEQPASEGHQVVRPVGEPSAWVPIWRRPWMSIGGPTYGSSLLSEAGVRNVLADSDDPYPTVGIEQAAAWQPDFVLAPSEPYPFSERHRAELEKVAPVVFVDGRDLFWWGDRTRAALNRLTELAGRLAAR
jgi:ABC-type Fe3+-hydroxamate transport system substrate-binding protein